MFIIILEKENSSDGNNTISTDNRYIVIYQTRLSFDGFTESINSGVLIIRVL